MGTIFFQDEAAAQELRDQTSDDRLRQSLTDDEKWNSYQATDVDPEVLQQGLVGFTRQRAMVEHSPDRDRRPGDHCEEEYTTGDSEALPGNQAHRPLDPKQGIPSDQPEAEVGLFVRGRFIQ